MVCRNCCRPKPSRKRFRASLWRQTPWKKRSSQQAFSIRCRTRLVMMSSRSLAGPVATTICFVIGTVITSITPLAGTFLEDKAPVQKQARGTVTVQPAVVLGLSFYLLLIASTLVNASNSFTNLGRPLVMDKKGFDSEAMSSVITIGGAVGIPVPLRNTASASSAYSPARRTSCFRCLPAARSTLSSPVVSTPTPTRRWPTTDGPRSAVRQLLRPSLLAPRPWSRRPVHA